MSTPTAQYRQMPPGAITGPSAWYGRDLARTTDWIYEFSPAELAEIDGAVARTRGRDLAGVTREDFPLPTFASKLDGFRRELLHGLGFVLLRGLPVDRYSREEAALAYWGLARTSDARAPRTAPATCSATCATSGATRAIPMRASTRRVFGRTTTPTPSTSSRCCA